MKVGVLGANGLLGSQLVDSFRAWDNDVVGITRDNYEESRYHTYDLFINANGNSRKYWANENPLEDFHASTESVYNSIFDFKFDKYVYVSSVDVYNSMLTKQHASFPVEVEYLSHYGFNKYLSENIVLHYCKDCLVFRASALLGKGLKKGIVMDIINNDTLYVTLDSELQFMTTREAASIINHIAYYTAHRNDIINLAGKGTVSVEELIRILGKNPELFKIDPDAKKQNYDVYTKGLEMFYALETSKDYVNHFIKEIGYDKRMG